MTDFKRWSIVDIDASKPLAPLLPQDNSQGTLLYVWWNSLPLGHEFVTIDRLPMTEEVLRREVIAIMGPTTQYYVTQYSTNQFDSSPPSDLVGELDDTLAGIATPVSILEKVSHISDTGRPNVSVVVCTRDRPQSLAVCLSSLRRLSTAPEQIIVVDNASVTEETKDIACAVPGVVYVRESRPGLDIARNTGFQTATTEIVAFVDDDVEIESDWLDGIIRGFQDSEVMALTGLVLAAELETEAQFVFERYWPFNRGYVPRLYGPAYFEATRKHGTPSWIIGAGANMAFRRVVFDAIGGFDERLDVGAAGCSGDSEYWYRMLSSGYTIRYEPTAVVRHYHRRDEAGLRKQLFAYMRGHTAALLVQHERTGDRGNLRRLFVSLPRYYARLWLSRLVRRKTKRQSFLGVELAGCFSGVRYYVRNRRYRTSHSTPLT